MAPLFYFPRWYLNLTTCVNNLHYEKFQDGTVKCIEDEIPFEVPEGWAWCRLNDIYNFIDYRGATPTKITNGIPLVTAKNVKSGYIDYTIDDYISEEEFKERQQRGISKKGDILFTTEAPLGNAALADMEKFSAGQRLITFQQYGSKNELINYVMLMFILSDFFQQQLYVNKTGSTVAGIKAAILKTLWIPVPPYNEQLRISNTLKSAINLIESISKNKEILSTSISNTKSKILDLAIRGKLVPQDPNDEPASVLIERIRAEKEELIKQGKIKRNKRESVIFKGDDNSYYLRTESKAIEITNELPYKIPDSWEWAKIGDILQVNPRNKIEDLLEVSFIPMPLIDGGFSGKHTSEERVWRKVKSGFTHFMEGDIGIAKITPCFENRKSVIFKNLKNGYGAGTTELHILRPYESTILPEYVLAYVKSSMFISKGKQEFTGAVGQQRIGKEYLENSYFPIPPLEEQVRIVEQISTVYKQLNMISEALV